MLLGEVRQPGIERANQSADTFGWRTTFARPGLQVFPQGGANDIGSLTTRPVPGTFKCYRKLLGKTDGELNFHMHCSVMHCIPMRKSVRAPPAGRGLSRPRLHAAGATGSIPIPPTNRNKGLLQKSTGLGPSPDPKEDRAGHCGRQHNRTISGRGAPAGRIIWEERSVGQTGRRGAASDGSYTLQPSLVE